MIHGSGGARTLNPNDRFPRDYWLTPRTVLTRKTNINKIHNFCVRHGAQSEGKQIAVTTSRGGGKDAQHVWSAGHRSEFACSSLTAAPFRFA